MAAAPASLSAGTVTFAEFDGMGNDSPLPTGVPVLGLPDGVTAVWNGVFLHTTAGDTPMSIFPSADVTGGDDATIVFSAQVILPSMNVYDTSWGSALSVVGRLNGAEVWRYTSPGNLNWTKITTGAGKAIDTLVFEGKWNHYDDMVIDLAPVIDTDGDTLPDNWEESYFPGDLTKLSATSDFDGDGLLEPDEFARKTSPKLTDTDADGLSDKVETNTGFVSSPDDTGTDPLKPDTDNDGRKDGDEINGMNPTDPFIEDSDGDTFSDGEEVAGGHNPADPGDNILVTAIADSSTQFSGVQGQDYWQHGYRNFSADGGGVNYSPTNFIPFQGGDGMGDWDGQNQQWTGSMWDLNTASAAPWTELGRENLHPNTNPQVHWTIRRWVATSISQVTPLALRWHAHKSNTSCGNGVTAGIYINGMARDVVWIPSSDGTGVTRIYFANIAPNDVVDLVLSPRGQDGSDADGCDGSVNRLMVDTVIPENPVQPDGTVFVPAGAGDSDGDLIPDVWEKIYFPNDLTKLSRSGDNDSDGANDFQEFERGSDPTKSDTDGDGLLDGVETGTGKWVSNTDTGSNPKLADSDSDGLSDAVEANRVPPTDPNLADTDKDGFSDAAEIQEGTDPLNAGDNVLAFVIANSQAEFSGVQGSKGWYNGFIIHNPEGGTVDYDPNQAFIPFVGGAGQGAWDGSAQQWTGDSWDLNTAGEAPWTFQGALDVHPNGTNNPVTIGGIADPTQEQWVVRRWVAAELAAPTNATVIWQVRKTNLNNDGVTGLLFINGILADSEALPGNGTGAVRRYRAALKPTDIVDLAVSPAGQNGLREDWSDGSQSWFWIDTRPAPASILIEAPAVDLVLNKVTLKWNSQAGAKYTVWTSSNLTSWTNLQNVDSGGTETTFTDTLPSPAPQVRFYRVSPQ